ncbi:hypothetical protein PHET_09269 [Paragonimus heterotremus]|uniref:PRA1 family protein n=1 Tax=Paragonimus heterotremus TaxID=100268 RepID=A0A8J4WNK4_9TREM|nr:hypothetical protein PHET_09269 [Paragonimus heterotremus]
MRSVSLRSYHEFIGRSARFSIPADSSWRNRAVANLIYYQTNYFLLSLCIFILLSLTDTLAVLVGLLFICVPILFLMLMDIAPAKVRDPRIVLPAIVITGALFIYYINHVLRFTVMVLIPSLVVILHALLRQRNIKTKITKFMESTRTTEQKTPMGYILELSGINVNSFEVDL